MTSKLLLLKAAWTPRVFLWAFTRRSRCKTRKEVMVRISSIPRLRCGNPPFSPLWMGDEMYHVKHPMPTVLGKFEAVNVYIPDQLPAVSDLTSTGIPAWWRTVCWNSLSARRPPDVPASGNVCCSFGAQVPPHLLSSCWHWGGWGWGVAFTSQRICGVYSTIWRYTFFCSDSQTRFNSQFLARD